MDFVGIVVLVLAVALVVFTVAFNAVRRKKGKSSCCCDTRKGKGGCAGCPCSGACHPPEQKKN